VTTDTLVTEKDFQRTVLELAKLTGWQTYHTFDSRRSEAGFPDLVLARDGRIIAAELKTESGRVTEAQRDWLTALASCPGVEVFVWRPSDWTAIEQTLKLKRTRAGGIANFKSRADRSET